jgi:long-subunit fatty acid transport protein
MRCPNPTEMDYNYNPLNKLSFSPCLNSVFRLNLSNSLKLIGFMRKSVFAAIIVISGIINISAQNTFEFLRMDLSPRAAALGGSFSANQDDPDVIFYNPAGIKELSATPVSFSFTKHLMDINFASFSMSKEFENIGRFGAAVRYANYGTFTKADEYANKTGEYSVNEVALVVGYADRFDENFNYGANIKFIHSAISEYSSSAIALDLGLQYYFPEENISIALSALHLGTQLSSYIETKEDLPLDITLGVSYKLKHLPLKGYLDFHRLNEKSDGFAERFKYFTAGAEFQISKVLTLRLGYENQKRKELKIDDFSGLAGFNLGVGVTIKSYQFNYAYSSLGEIGAIHRIGIATSF